VPSINNAFSGSYTVASNGRGTMTFIGGRTYVFYLGPTGSAVFQETDINRPEISIHGMFIQQQTAAFTLASIQGNYSINSNGALAVNGQVQVMSGQMAANGAGAVTSGEIDINTAGTLTPAEAVSGTYLLPAASGRTTLVLNPTGDNRNFAVYVVNSAQAIIMGIDVGRVAAGALLRQF